MLHTCIILNTVPREQHGSLSKEASGTLGLLSASRVRFRGICVDVSYFILKLSVLQHLQDNSFPFSFNYHFPYFNYHNFVLTNIPTFSSPAIVFSIQFNPGKLAIRGMGGPDELQDVLLLFCGYSSKCQKEND